MNIPMFVQWENYNNQLLDDPLDDEAAPMLSDTPDETLEETSQALSPGEEDTDPEQESEPPELPRENESFEELEPVTATPW